MRQGLIVALLLGMAVAGHGQRAPTYGKTLDGRPVTALGDAGTRAVVLFFVASDCPVSNRTFPEMKRVREEFAGVRSGKGVRVWFVYSNAGEAAGEVAKHQASYDAGGEVVLDDAGGLVRLAGARVTPEAAVLVPAAGGWRPMYVGRVDDRYVRLGLERPQATEHFAERAVEAVLNGRAAKKDTGQPVGCGIMGRDMAKAAR